MGLFEEQTFALPLCEGRQGEIRFWPNWLSSADADSLLSQAIDNVPWRQDTIHIAGKAIPLPRLQQWYGELGTSYTYSNIRLAALAFPDWLDTVRGTIERDTGMPFNRALVNHYRSGADSVDWHADDEAELGPEPVIASLSVGEERVFQMRHTETQQQLSIVLPHGSLLVMGAGIQAYWQHRVAKDKCATAARVNFTFRYMA